MTEKFLHYLWKMKLLVPRELITTAGENIRILSLGEHNSNAGPDFLNARIQIGETLWAGNVEIHLKSSEWSKHGHDRDPAYDNIILHAVYENDEDICRKDGTRIPCLELKNRFDTDMYQKYQVLMQSDAAIPCHHHLRLVDSIIFQQLLHRLLVERLEEKTGPILHTLQTNQHNWEETFYSFIAKAFGANVNAEPFTMLARNISLKVLAKHKNNLMQLETLLFGGAGFLDEDFSDAYPNELKKEYTFLKKKYGLLSLKKHIWKFLRLRPANFPTIRIAQFAQLVFQSSHLFSKILEQENMKSIGAYFTVETSPYWIDHYRFDKSSISLRKPFGQKATDLLLINTIAPFLFMYGKSRDDEKYISRSLTLLESVCAEENNIILNWKQLGISATNAFETQALLQLRNNYCKNYRCLECSIGHKILSKTE